MAKSITDSKKRGRGRPPTTGIGQLIGARWPLPEISEIDRWRKAQPDSPPRAEAIRRLVRKALDMDYTAATECDKGKRVP